MTLKSNHLTIIMLWASGAAGSEALNTLLQIKSIQQLTLLGRNPISNLNVDFVQQRKINISNTSTYAYYI